MKYKIGDKIKFLNDVGGGTITKILDKETVSVLNEDGFEIPTLIRELIEDETVIEYKSSSYQDKKEEVKQLEIDEPAFYTENPDINFYLAFVPTNKENVTDSDYKVYLINDSNYYAFYNYAVKNTSGKYSSIVNQIEPNTKELLETLGNESFGENLEIVVQLMFFDKQEYELKEPFSKHFKLRAVKFYKASSFTENDFFDEFVMIIPILEENAMQKAVEELKNTDLSKVVNQKEKENKKVNRPRIFKKPPNKNLKEVDLHIHELVDDESGLSKHDKLELQIERFHAEMKSAVNEKYKKIVFIHGVGNGTLKHKIRSEMKSKYKKYEFQDASFKEYGYGATMILLHK